MNNFDEMPKGMTPNLPLWSFQFQSNSKLALRSRKDLEIHLITRALKDEDFKRELIANPKAVIESELGTKLPDELEINVLEETENTIYMVLPCNPYEGLSEEELQASLGMSYEDVAQWVLEQHRSLWLDEASSVDLIARIWKDQAIKQELLSNFKGVIEKELMTNIAENSNIYVLEESSNCCYILLPKIADNFDLQNQEWLESNLDSMNLAMIGASGGGGGGSTQAGCGTTTPAGTCGGTIGCWPFPITKNCCW